MKKLDYYQTREEKVANSAFSALGCKWVQPIHQILIERLQCTRGIWSKA